MAPNKRFRTLNWAFRQVGLIDPTPFTLNKLECLWEAEQTIPPLNTLAWNKQHNNNTKRVPGDFEGRAQA